MIPFRVECTLGTLADCNAAPSHSQMGTIMQTGLRGKNLTVAETMCLVAGAAVGLWRVKTAITLGFWDPSDWSSWFFAFYSALAGVNMVTMLRLHL